MAMMNRTVQSRLKKVIPLVLLAFVVCGVGGLYCPMPASASDSQHSSGPLHHSSSPFSSDCPDSLINSSNLFEFDESFDWSDSGASHFEANLAQDVCVSRFLRNDLAPPSNSYPLLYLLFAVFLN